MHHRRTLALAATAALLLTSAARATRPQSWTFASQKDFFEGRFENTVVDSYGQLTLGRSLTPVPVEHAGESVQAFAQTPDGSLYVATSPSAKIFRIKDSKTDVVYTAPKGFDDITAMATDARGNLLVALSGESAKLISINPLQANGDSAPATRFENKDVDYIWAIVPAPDGTLYLGTGPHGKVYKLAGTVDPEVVLETGQKNVTALALDKSNNLIAGTDAHGLVIRVDAATKKTFVLLDAGKVDVNALATDAAGNLYVATAKAEFNEVNGKGGPSGDSMDEPETRSKPDAPETQPVDPPADDAGKTLPQGKGPIAPGIPMILGAADPDLPADLKALLKKAAADSKLAQSPHAPKNKSGSLATHASHMHAKTPHADETPSSDDLSGVTRISPDGLATPLVQDQGNNYSLLLLGDELLIGTGDEGKLYAYRLKDESLALIARVKEQEISNLFADKNGTIFLGTGNMAQIYQMSAAVAHKGSFTSQVLDASHTAAWGHALIDSSPDGAKVLIESRSGNTQDVDAHPKFWSDWAPAGDGSKITSPAARFLQFRITLSSENKTATPAVGNLRLAYQSQNLAPKIKNVSLDLPGAASDGSADPDSLNSPDDTSPPPAEKLSHISWDAADPNGDTLLYRLYYKQITPDGKDPWTLLARDLKDAVYEWDTRAIPDGKYQVKVVASDSPDNPAPDALETARASVPFILNHTPPTLSDLTPAVDVNKATVTGTAKDALSPVTDVRYQVDGNISGGGGGDWQPAAASDKIFDSPQEAFTLVTRSLSVGPHRITIRATDAAGNNSYKAVTIIVKP